MSPPRPTTGSWADTRACCPASSRTSPRWPRASGRSTSAAAPGALTGELVARLGADVGGGGRSVGVVRRRDPGAAPGRRRPPGASRAAAVPAPTRSTRRSPSSSSTSCADPVAGLHRDAARDPARRRRRGLRLGPRRPPGAAPAVLGRRPVAGPGPSTTSRSLPGTREGHLVELFRAAGLRGRDRDGAGDPGGASDLRRMVGAVHARRRPGGRLPRAPGPGPSAAIREAALRRAAAEPIEITAVAWAARGLA